MSIPHRQMAEKLRAARLKREAIPPFSAEMADLSIADAEEVQRLGLEAERAEGRRLVGYKMGLTSRAKQRDVNVFAPIHGYLLADMEVTPGEPVDTSSRIHPRTEPEIAVVLARRLKGADVRLRDVRAAIAGVYPALEIIDSRYQSFSFKLPDVIADNTSASGFLLGDRSFGCDTDLRLLGVVVKKNGEVLETGAPAAVLGNPLLSVVALTRALAARGQALEAGMVVLTGGITAAVPFASCDLIEMVWPGETIGFRAR